MLTKANLLKRDIVSDSLCPTCGLEKETRSHILCSCSQQEMHGRGGYAVESCRKALLINSKFINILDELQCRLEEKEFELMVVEARQI